MANELDFEVYGLNNGLIVGLKKTPTKTVTGALRVHQGSSHERKDEKGLAHFLEHCIIRGGTEKYSPKEIEERTSLIEGKRNATTRKEFTFFNGQMLPSTVGIFLDSLSEIFFAPRFDPVYVERERQRVLREIEEKNGGPNIPNVLLYKQALYRGHPMESGLEGHKEVVKSARIAQLKDFHQRGYSAKNMDLTLVGCLPDNIKELIEQSFGHRRSGQSTRIDYPVLAPLDEKRVMHVLHPGSNHRDGRLIAEVTFSLITVPDMHPDNFANRILFKIFGELPNSRLNTRLSLEEGLTYGVGSNYNTDCNAGQNSMEFTCPVQSWNRSIDVMFEEMNRLREQGVNEKELEKCKREIMFDIAKIAESNVSQANVIVDYLDSGRTLEDISNGYSAVTIQDIQRVAQTYLPEDRENGKYVLMIEDPTLNAHL